MNVLTSTIKNASENGKSFSTVVRAKKWDFLHISSEYAILTDYVQDYTVNTAGTVVGVESHGH